MTTQPDLAELRALLARCTALPITARPQEYDDWGTIRSVERGDDGFQRVFARVQIHASLEEQNEHRAAKTDPTQDTMDLIVAAMNALPWLLDRAAVGGGDQEVGLREAVARILDPMSFDNRARAFHMRPLAYDKADAILALTRPDPAKAVEGEFTEWLEAQLYEHDPMCGGEDCKRTAGKLAPLILAALQRPDTSGENA